MLGTSWKLSNNSVQIIGYVFLLSLWSYDMSDTGKRGVTSITLMMVRVHSVDQIISVTIFFLNREGLSFGQNCLNNSSYASLPINSEDIKLDSFLAFRLKLRASPSHYLVPLDTFCVILCLKKSEGRKLIEVVFLCSSIQINGYRV